MLYLTLLIPNWKITLLQIITREEINYTVVTNSYVSLHRAQIIYYAEIQESPLVQPVDCCEMKHCVIDMQLMN